MTASIDERILYCKPSITDREVAYASDAARNGWGPNCYDYIHRFEAAFRDHLGTRFAAATSSCTGALHLGLAALGIGSGDEVILADLNWIASAAPIMHLGATPVFVDVLRDTWCLDPEQVERAISPRTRAILAVHIYGNVCAMDALAEIGRQRGIPVIEDAAEAIGSEDAGRRAGSIGRFGVFSFHGTKTFTTGEGGMLVTSDEGLFDRAETLARHGRDRHESRQFWSKVIGFKYRMSNVDAAIGLAQVERADELIARKREIFHYYKANLQDLPGVSMNPELPASRNGFWMPTVVFDPDSGVTREYLLEALCSANVDARVVFWPLSSMPPFGSGTGLPVARGIAEHGINLPSYHDMTQAQQDRVIGIVRSVARRYAGGRERRAQ
jgi:perosamine synthetase